MHIHKGGIVERIDSRRASFLSKNSDSPLIRKKSPLYTPLVEESEQEDSIKTETLTTQDEKLPARHTTTHLLIRHQSNNRQDAGRLLRIPTHASRSLRGCRRGNKSTKENRSQRIIIPNNQEVHTSNLLM